VNREAAIGETSLMHKLKMMRNLAVRLMLQHRLYDWEFQFNRRKSQMGVCHYPHHKRAGRIELSIYFVAHNTEDEICDTILHEIAHALVGPRHGHDAVWKAKCLEIGAVPKRCGSAVMPLGNWRASCPGCQLNFHRHRPPKRRTGFYCRSCGPERGSIVWQRLK
jgi:predicted SprT family Zn-dependent metalloprotease